MSIFKRSALDLDSTVIIKPKKLQEEGVPSKFGGNQDRWWIEVGGEDSTTYSGYYEEGRPDAFGQALRQAVAQGAVVTITKGFNKEKNRASYDYMVGEGKADSPAPRSDGPAPQKSNGTKREDDYKLAGVTKGLMIAYQGIGKFMGIATESPEQNHARIVAQFELMERWAEERAQSNPAADLYKAIDAANLGSLKENFIGWLANHYKQSALEELTEKEIAHALENLGAAIEAFHGQQDAEEERQRDQSIIGEPEIPEDSPPF